MTQATEDAARLAHQTPPATQPSATVGEDFLAQLRRVNTERYQAWVGDGEDAGILFDAAELGGEVGELLNVVKKLEREERGWRGSRAAPEDFADECADVLICLDKLARRKGVDLKAATVRKFNATSDKVGLPQRLAILHTPPPVATATVVERKPAGDMNDYMEEIDASRPRNPATPTPPAGDR